MSISQQELQTTAVAPAEPVDDELELERAYRELAPERQTPRALMRRALEERLDGPAARNMTDLVSEMMQVMDPSFQRLFQSSMAPHEREDLARGLKVVADAFRTAKSGSDVVSFIEGEIQRLDSEKERLYQEYFEEIGELEQNVRGLDLLFQNTKGLGGPLAVRPTIALLDMPLEKAEDVATIEAFVKPENQAFQGSRNKGMLLVPGYQELPLRQEIERMALRQGMIYVADLDNYRSKLQLERALERMERRGDSLVRDVMAASTSVLVAPYLLVRYAHAFEDDGLWVPASWALAGAISRCDRRGNNGLGIDTPPTSEKFGKLMGVLGTPFDLDTDDVRGLRARQINLVYRGTNSEYVITSGYTLADDAVFMQYHARRIFDYVGKRAASLAWKVIGLNMKESDIQEYFYGPARELLEKLEKGGLLSDWTLSVNYDRELLARGELQVDLRVQPVMVGDRIVIDLQELLRGRAPAE